jgi:hypothetical protein
VPVGEQPPADPEGADMPNLINTEDEFHEALAAVHEGRATDLMRCYLCEPDVSKRFETGAGPLRGVVRNYVTNQRQDATEAYVLTCGHTVI